MQCVQAISNSRGAREESAFEVAVVLDLVGELWSC